MYSGTVSEGEWPPVWSWEGSEMERLIESIMTETEKPTNPKDACGIRKVPHSCTSQPVMAEVAVGMLEGALKYGRSNYRVIGVRASVYYDAARRHIDAWWEGEDIDPDSGLSHLAKAMASLMVLRDAQVRGKMNDDRPPGTVGFITALNEKVAELLDKYPTPKAAYVAEGPPAEYNP